MTVPAPLLFAGYSDLAVLVWTLLRLSFGRRRGYASYVEFAERLGLADLSVGAMEHRFGLALQPLLTTWVVRSGLGGRRYAYQAVDAVESKYSAMIRVSDLHRLSDVGYSRLAPCDVVDFARWQLECHPRGWTAEPARTIAARWGICHAGVIRSRSRLADRGLLTIEPRGCGRLSDLVWLADVHDPWWKPAPRRVRQPSDDRPINDRRSQPRATDKRAASSQTQSVSRRRGWPLQDYLRGRTEPEVSLSVAQVDEFLGGSLPQTAWRSTSWWALHSRLSQSWRRAGRLAELDLPGQLVRFVSISADTSRLAQLREERERRRQAAISALIAPDFRVESWMPHEVYLLHFPDEACFKVGLTQANSSRVHQFRRHGAVEVERVTVSSRRMAELVEADVLLVMRPWHRLGERDRPGGGYTEMWSDEGPTVDLWAAALAAERLVQHLQRLCEHS